MPGRHAAGRAWWSASGHSGNRRVTFAVLASLLVVAGIVSAVVVGLRHRPAHPPAAAPATTPSCSGAVAVSVVTAPEIETAIRTIAQQWMASKPAVAGSCVSATVTGQDAAAAQQALASASAVHPMVWIPDSTLWGKLLTVTKPGLASAVTIGRPIATSPLVLAASPSGAGAVAAAAQAGWGAAMTAGKPVALPDPLKTSSGALVALALQAQVGTAPGAAATLVGAFIRLAANTLPTTSAGFAALQAHPASTPPFVASEHDVIQANAGKSTPVAAAVYPSGPSPVLDFPVVQVRPTGTDTAVSAAMSMFGQHLTTAAAQRQLQAAGLRDDAASPLRGLSPGVTGQAVTPAPTPDASRLPTAARLWRAAVKPSNLLAVIDVSGSMGDPAGNGQTKIQVAAGAAVTGVTLVPDSWRLGLWSFSTHETPDTDWTEVVPMGPVAAQRKTLEAGAAALPGRVGGNTGLYDTALAAFQHVSSLYRPDSVNVVTLLTDGANVDPEGIDLPTLLSQIKSQFNPGKPVKIVTIGVGADADQVALKAISDATDGQSYHVTNPADIRGVLLDAIVANN
jgi:Ca-activated chloride channel homolog